MREGAAHKNLEAPHFMILPLALICSRTNFTSQFIGKPEFSMAFESGMSGVSGVSGLPGRWRPAGASLYFAFGVHFRGEYILLKVQFPLTSCSGAPRWAKTFGIPIKKGRTSDLEVRPYSLITNRRFISQFEQSLNKKVPYQRHLENNEQRITNNENRN